MNPESVDGSVLSLEMLKNESVSSSSYKLTVKNTSDKELGMVIVIFYMPTALKKNLNDLETLRKNGIIGKYLSPRGYIYILII